MSANSGHPKMPDWVRQDQIEAAKQMRASTNQAGPPHRSGRSTPSTRGKGPAMTSTRPMTSSTNSYSSFTSTTASRNTHAPSATQSGVPTPHYSKALYSVGPSTPAPNFKSPPRQKPASPIRGTNGPKAGPAAKPKSPPKLRTSILVSGQVQPMLSPKAAANVCGQEQWASAHVEPARTFDPRFVAAESFHPMAQQPCHSYGVNNDGLGTNHNLHSAHAATTLVGGHSIGRLTDQHLPPPLGEPIVNNWTNDDPNKPIIAGHLRQDAKVAVAECAAAGGWTVPEISSDGVSIGGDSIHAPGGAGPSQYYSNFNSRASKLPSAIGQRSISGVNSGDGDVEMSDGPPNTQSSAPQGPLDWDKLPTLAASKYANNGPSFFTKITAPKPASFNNKENIKPTPEGQMKDFTSVAKNIVSEVSQTPGPFNPVSNQPAQAPAGFGAAAQNAKSNPFHANGTQASQNATKNGFGAPSASGAAPWSSYEHSDHMAQNFVSVSHPIPQSAPVGNVWGSQDQSTASSQPHYSGAQPAAINAWGTFDQSKSNGQTQFGSGPPAVLTGPSWRSVDHSASNGQNQLGGAPPATTADNAWVSVNFSAHGTQAQYGGVPPADNGWGSINHQSSNNGHARFGGTQQAAPTGPAWGSLDQSKSRGQQFGNAQHTPPSADGWGFVGQSVSNGQTHCVANHAAAPTAPAGNTSGPSNHQAPYDNGVQPGYMPNGSGATTQPSTQVTGVWGTATQTATNLQYTQGISGSNSFEAPQNAGNNQVGYSSNTTHHVHPGQGPQHPNMSEILGNIANELRDLPMGNVTGKQAPQQSSQFGQEATGPTVASWNAQPSAPVNATAKQPSQQSSQVGQQTTGSTAAAWSMFDGQKTASTRPPIQSGQQIAGSTPAAWNVFNDQQPGPAKPQVAAVIKKPAGLKESRWA